MAINRQLARPAPASTKFGSYEGLPVKCVCAIQCIRRQSALCLASLILPSQKKACASGSCVEAAARTCASPGERFAFKASTISAETSLSTTNTSFKSRS